MKCSTVHVAQITLMLLVCVNCGSDSFAETVQKQNIMEGTPHATTCYTKIGAQRGPKVFIIGGCHGNETAGYLAADEMMEWKITTGTLVLLPRAHVSAIKAKQRAYPGNMNAMFPGNPTGNMMERLAHSIWELIKQHQPDMLITLHESVGFHRKDRNRFGQTLTYDFHELDGIFHPAIEEMNTYIDNPAHHFLPFVYPVATCPTYCAYKYLHIPSTSVETCMQLDLQERIRQQKLMSAILMRRQGLEWEGLPQLRPLIGREQPASEPEDISNDDTQNINETASENNEKAEALPTVAEPVISTETAALPTKQKPASFPWLGLLGVAAIAIGIGLGLYAFISLRVHKSG